MIERLQTWYGAPPSLQGIRAATLQEMLGRTLALYYDLQGAAVRQAENAGA